MTWEERFHPLRDEWVVIAAHRQNRPWIGEEVTGEAPPKPPYLSDCYLCPGNARVGGARNARYESVFVFDNDHPCVGLDAPPVKPPTEFHRARPARGIARVVCFSPRHDLTMAEMEPKDIAHVLFALQEQYRELGERKDVSHVLMFENKGDVCGVSNPHPHGQIYATNFVFKTIENEVRATERYFDETGRVLFQDVIEAEVEDGRRIVADHGSALAFVPYFARYPYETYVAPKETHASIADLSRTEIADLASVLQETTTRFDNLWKMSFPYVMVLHQAPTDGRDHGRFHFHIEFHPPLRKPNLLKYLAGPEIGGGSFLNDTLPEAKAAELQAVSPVHHRKGRT